jgi:FlaA1/EpsC-like NDP-sugar epimerase
MKRFRDHPGGCHLVLQASSMARWGSVRPEHGEQVRILDLARSDPPLWSEPGKDIEIVFTGIVRVRKMSESCGINGQYEPTKHPDIVLLAAEDVLNGEDLQHIVDELIHLAREGDQASIVNILDECIPQAAVRSEPPPDLTSLL